MITSQDLVSFTTYGNSGEQEAVFYAAYRLWVIIVAAQVKLDEKRVAEILGIAPQEFQKWKVGAGRFLASELREFMSKVSQEKGLEDGAKKLVF